MADRERALAETERRQQWHTTLDARMKAKPESDEPESDDDDDDDEADEDNGDDDGGSPQTAAEERRQFAWQETNARGDNAWCLDPRRQSAVMRQAASWRNGA
jgi:hypothetical protein